MRKLISMLFILATVALVGCNDGKGDGDSGDGEVNSTTISAKWIISGNSEYQSIEFNKSGNYLLVKKADVPKRFADRSFMPPMNILAREAVEKDIYFGAYTIKQNIITLSGFGTIIVAEIGSAKISFELKESGEPPVSITANKAIEMTSDTKTEMLCKTWILVSCVDNGILDNEYVGTHLLFSRAGTYFVQSKEMKNAVAGWKWNDTKTKFYYSWDTPPVWDERRIVTINELTNTKLVVTEGSIVWTFKPRQ